MQTRLAVWVEGDRDRRFVEAVNSAPCVASRKDKLKARYPALKDQEIIVVSTEIESWYLAGLTPEGATALNVNPPSSTDHLTKEDLERLRPPRFDSQLDFLMELLKYFDGPVACARNRSLAYLHRMLA